MDLTKNFVKNKRPCADGFRWFLRNHADGSDYQPLLNALVDAGRVDDACWLLTQFGPTDEVLKVDAIDAEAMVFAGTLEVQGNIEVASVLRAGRSIRAGGGIRAGKAIIAGEDVQAGGSIRCDGTLEAGGDIKVAWGIEVEDAIRSGGDVRAEWEVICGASLTLDGNLMVGQT